MVTKTVGIAVAALGDLAELAPTLKELGGAHVPRGVLKEHYPMVMGALTKTLKDSLKEKWTPELE